VSALDGLNPAQQEAVRTTEGPLLILAGPGSGKTRVIVHRVAYLLEQGVSPRNILAVTFTNKAAREMRERLERLVGARGEGLTVGTFHATCARWLRREGRWIGLEPGFAIYDDGDQVDLIKTLIREAGLDEKHFGPRAVLREISASKSELISVDQYRLLADSRFRRMVADLYAAYEARLRAHNALDFDDLLEKAVRLFEAHPDVLARYQERYRYLLVDEFQDTNVTQYRLARLLAGKYRNLCVVGDPDQSIYSWRKADIRNILNLEKDYPDLKTIVLGQNYRSTQAILDVAQAVISANEQRLDKQLWTTNDPGERVTLYAAFDEREEALFVVREIERLLARGTQRGEVAVLYRTNAQSRAVEDVFVRYNMPYRLVGGTRFYERKEVKDVLAYLRLICNPADAISLQRVINTPPRGLGPKTVADLAAWATALGISQREALLRLAGLDERRETEAGALDQKPAELVPFSPRAREALASFGRLLFDLRSVRDQVGPEQLLDELLGRIDLEAFLTRDGSEESLERWQNVQELRTKARDYRELEPREALERFLEDVSLVQDVDTLEDVRDQVTLITLHAAKGLEFPYVFVIGLEEGLIPHARSLDDPAMLEEERRLLYVGITRAMRRLYLSHADRRSGYLGSQQRGASSFLDVIPRRMLERARPGAARAASSARRPRQYELDDFEPGDRLSLPSEPSRPETFSNPEPAWLEEPPSPEPAAPRQVSFRGGERVAHPIFGVGTVLESATVGDDEQVTVQFQGESRPKKLSLAFARIERVED
jgi:DNA helicase-2/ATP-dependent DNA helicase PcrA